MALNYTVAKWFLQDQWQVISISTWELSWLGNDNNAIMKSYSFWMWRVQSEYLLCERENNCTLLCSFTIFFYPFALSCLSTKTSLEINKEKELSEDSKAYERYRDVKLKWQWEHFICSFLDHWGYAEDHYTANQTRPLPEDPVSIQKPQHGNTLSA